MPNPTLRNAVGKANGALTLPFAALERTFINVTIGIGCHALPCDFAIRPITRIGEAIGQCDRALVLR